MGRFLVHGSYLVTLFDKLHPGLSDPRIPAMLQVVKAMAKDVKQKQKNNNNGPRISAEEIQSKWDIINSWASECLDYYKVEVQIEQMPTGCTMSKECTFLAQLITESLQHLQLGGLGGQSLSARQKLNLRNSILKLF